ncbi:hypothetical protein EBZ80_11270 [bacterium]|nr:hypothetical protein [bacterium]
MDGEFQMLILDFPAADVQVEGGVQWNIRRVVHDPVKEPLAQRLAHNFLHARCSQLWLREADEDALTGARQADHG